MSRMLRRTKSSSLLPIVRLTNYFYPEDKDSAQVTSMEVYSTQAAHSGRQGALTPPPDYGQLYQAMQVDTLNEEDRVRRKYACQGLKLVASSLAEEGTSMATSRTESEALFSKELYVNGVEYILRGLPPDLPTTERHRIHTLLKRLQPLPSTTSPEDEPYPFIIFLFRQLGLLLKHMSPLVQSLLLRMMEFERKNNVGKGMMEMGLGVVERGVGVAVRMGLGDAVLGLGSAVGRGMGESYRVYRGEK